MKYGYFNYNPVGPSIFFYTDDNGTPKEMQFNLEDPARLVEAVSGILDATNIDHVLCNNAGLELSDAIKTYMLKKYSDKQVEFEINK